MILSNLIYLSQIIWFKVAAKGCEILFIWFDVAKTSFDLEFASGKIEDMNIVWQIHVDMGDFTNFFDEIPQKHMVGIG